MTMYIAFRNIAQKYNYYIVEHLQCPQGLQSLLDVSSTFSTFDNSMLQITIMYIAIRNLFNRK